MEQQNRTKIAVLSLMAGFIVFLIVDYTTMGVTQHVLEDFLCWVENNVWLGALLLALVYSIATVHDLN